MRFHGSWLGEGEAGGWRDAYQVYGVREHERAVVVVRRDGVVGTVVGLAGGSERVEAFLRSCLIEANSVG
jgi:hypothetical protein